ncbi:MAG: hypothetical protein ACTSUF_03730 [Candidatus Heimdallarchaeaceae archaeon]
MSLSRFMRVYPNLPIAERTMTCCTIDGEPISWSAAYKEIKANTQLGQRIQQTLENLGLI